MPTKISFPYQFKLIKNEKIDDPVIYLNVVTQLGLRKIGFLVDSGSDAVVLPLSPYHFWFNFKPDNQTAITLGGVEGKGVVAYPGKIALQADEERTKDNLITEDIEEAILAGKVIEERLDDPRGESRLIAGFNKQGKPIHVVIGLRFGFPVIVTVYRPSEDEWISGKIRKSQRHE